MFESSANGNDNNNSSFNIIFTINGTNLYVLMAQIYMSSLSLYQQKTTKNYQLLSKGFERSVC